jgi:uncharacterized protein
VAVATAPPGETEVFVRQSLKEQGIEASVVLGQRGGASAHSASEIAREEFPELDVTVRGRSRSGEALQDPLAGYVKIEPEHRRGPVPA